MPALPPCLIEPIWQQFSALIPERRTSHPLGCLRIPDRVVFEKLVQVLVFGCAYERIADATCSATTLRDRRDEWIELGAMDALREIALEAYDRIVGLELPDVAVDCCITKAPCGGEKSGRSPVDRGKRGTKRSTAVDARGIPSGTVTASANRHDSPLLAETLDAVAETLGELPESTSIHLDRGYDSGASRAGATATFTFTGNSFSWWANKGSYGGRAYVFVDGAPVGHIVDHYATSNQPSQAIFTKSWPTSGTHTVKIKVEGTSGRPWVDVDRFYVTQPK